MMLPLCTRVTEGRRASIEYAIKARRPFVHEGDRGAARLDRVLDRLDDEALAAEPGHRLDAQGTPFADLGAELVAQKHEQPGRLGASGGVLDPGVHVFGVLAIDDDVELLGFPHRARHPGEVAHRPDTGVQIEQLAQGHIERADAAAHRGRERTLDGDAVAADVFERLLGEPVARLLERLLPREHLQPLHPALAPGDLLDHGVEHAARCPPDVGPGAVALDEWDHGPVGHHPPAIATVDPLPNRRSSLHGPAGVAPAERTHVDLQLMRRAAALSLYAFAAACWLAGGPGGVTLDAMLEIGRASGRERVDVSAAGGTVKRKVRWSIV